MSNARKFLTDACCFLQEPQPFILTHTNTQKHTHKHTHTNTHTHTHTNTHTHKHTHTHKNTQKHTQTHTNTHKHTQTHTNTHKHTQTHTKHKRNTNEHTNEHTKCWPEHVVRPSRNKNGPSRTSLSRTWPLLAHVVAGYTQRNESSNVIPTSVVLMSRPYQLHSRLSCSRDQSTIQRYMDNMAIWKDGVKITRH